MAEIKDKPGFRTVSVHGGELREMGSLAPPIYQTASFQLGEGFVYSRVANPTQQLLEKRMAALDQGEASLALASGMAAISTLLLTVLRGGGHVIAHRVMYGSTFELFTDLLPKLGVKVTMADLGEPGRLQQLITEDTRLVFLETPVNPTLEILDIQEIASICRESSALLAVDNTFMTPYLQQPLELGADIAVYSATKYLNGHGDTLAGIITGKRELVDACRQTLKLTGNAVSPFNAWLVARGLTTLAPRMEAHTSSALKIAEFLEHHPQIKSVTYPWLPGHPQYHLARKQMKGGGGMITFELSKESKIESFLDSLEICSKAVSLGDVRTLINHPATMTHRGLTAREQKEIGITPGMIRISVGLEDPEDIIQDLEKALERTAPGR